MNSNPYRNLVSIVRHCIQRNGWSELFLIPARMAASPLLIPILGRRKFGYREHRLDCFYHRYNVTWANERAVEVPIARHHLANIPPGSVLEVGNVMSHYQPVMHDVLDKYERAPGIINADITEFNPTRNYRLILSVSTFEHIGFDEETNVGSAEKIQAAIQHCRGFLEPGGELIITAATGYNPEFDALFRDNRVGAAQVTFLKRRSFLKWETCDEVTALSSRYHHPFAFGNAIVVAKFSQ